MNNYYTLSNGGINQASGQSAANNASLTINNAATSREDTTLTFDGTNWTHSQGVRYGGYKADD